MGGVLILFALVGLDAAVGRPHQRLCLGGAVRDRRLRLVGFFDDYLKLTQAHRTKGCAGPDEALSVECAIAVIGARVDHASHARSRWRQRSPCPFFKNLLVQLGWFFPVLAVLVIVGASNAVNLTDGLDGLAIVPVMIAAGCFALIAYLVGNAVFANYLQIHARARRGRAAGVLRRAGRRGARLPLVQRAARHGVHGRHRLARAGRRARRDRRRDQARDRARDRRRPVRARDRVGDHAGGLVQADRAARVPHGAAAPSFRARRAGPSRPS